MADGDHAVRLLISIARSGIMAEAAVAFAGQRRGSRFGLGVRRHLNPGNKPSRGATPIFLTMMAVSCLLLAGSVAHADEASYRIGIVEQQLTNPFFGALESAAVQRAKELGLQTMTAEASAAGDSASQVNAVENMINRSVKGIVLDPSNAFALNRAVKSARARGIVVVTTNTSLEPSTVADAAFETDNFAAGKLLGTWARKRLADTAAHVAMLDFDLSDKTSKARHDGFLAGFKTRDGSPEIAGTALTQANVETGQSSMENLLAAHSDINVVYTINEQAALGAAIAVRRHAKPVLLTSIDGSCAGVQAVSAGKIDATVMQFPSNMGRMAVDAIADAVKSRKPPSGTHDSGTTLITDHPVEGVTSRDSKWGLSHCWGASQ